MQIIIIIIIPILDKGLLLDTAPEQYAVITNGVQIHQKYEKKLCPAHVDTRHDSYTLLTEGIWRVRDDKVRQGRGIEQGVGKEIMTGGW